jgi:hypothetical protein
MEVCCFSNYLALCATTDPRQLRVGLYERARSLLFLTNFAATRLASSSPCGRFKRTYGSPTTFIGFDAMVGDEPQRLDQGLDAGRGRGGQISRESKRNVWIAILVQTRPGIFSGRGGRVTLESQCRIGAKSIRKLVFLTIGVFLSESDPDRLVLIWSLGF